MAWLSRIERSPNTVRVYAQDLKAFWEFLTARGLVWDRLTLEQLGLFTAWPRQPADNVVLLAGAEPQRAGVDGEPDAVSGHGFCEFHARHSVAVARELVDRSRSGRGSYKPFLDGIAPARDRARVGQLREPRRPPRTLSLERVAAMLDARRRLRDRFLFALLFGTGMRIDQALGLGHADFVSHERRVEIVARGQRQRRSRQGAARGSVPISGELVRLHSDYMHDEYGELDSDYVFVHLRAGHLGRPMRYSNVPASSSGCARSPSSSRR